MLQIILDTFHCQYKCPISYTLCGRNNNKKKRGEKKRQSPIKLVYGVNNKNSTFIYVHICMYMHIHMYVHEYKKKH